MKKKKNSTYLSRLNKSEKVFRLRSLRLLVRIVFPMRGLKIFTSYTVRLTNISEAEAIVLVPHPELIPEHFYLVLGHFEIFIACSRSKAEGSVVTLKFASEEPADFIDGVARIRVPSDGLSRIAGQFNNAIDQRISTRARFG